MKKEICKTYFKFKDEVINGWKVINDNGVYIIYTYTSCKALNNWQEFLRYKSYENILRYFENNVNSYNDISNSEWCKKELLWYKETLEKIKNYK